MAPKKHNGFMAFVSDWRVNNHEGRALTISEAVTKCGILWKNMSEQERGPYNSMAKNSNVLERAAKKERLTCLGDAVSKIEMEKNEAINAELQMKRKIERIILNAKNSIEKELEDEEFVFVSFNYFTKALTGDIYVPAEFSACRYSLKGGISSNYSSMINPGHIIFGQYSDAQHHSLTTHKLPLPPKAMGETNMGRLYIDILNWLSMSNDQEDQQYDHDPIIVYTTPALMPVVKSCFRYLGCEAETDKDARKIVVYDIFHLFHTLKKNVLDMAGVPNEHINFHVTTNFFTKDFFEFTADIACDYHEEIDRSKYCTKSMVMRWGFIFSDYICADLAIPLKPGKHIPPKVKPNYTVTPGDCSSNFDEVSLDSFYSAPSQIKKEIGSRDLSPTSSRQSVSSSYVPRDHTIYDGELSNDGEFPSLGGRRPKIPAKSHFSMGSGKRNPR
ncbi:protein maelstrom 2 [Drosophila obscura]|uniref:protein maelstrom 2 n=1 Tax=Drosophila obscura TaxID=7282 RepID=UPI001BB21ACC|nr:protein maelstrom 2 [Drosophila obscura]XP_022219725.2 protein maelstrom 2 [Drosophila obscura]XP_041449795.1 protein maelstrom 2 [Drosophila obscura]